MSVMVIDYGLGNLRSVKRAFEECGANVFISDAPKDMKNASHVVLPGVGAYYDGMKNLHEKHWVDQLHEMAEKGMPIIGICLGMQLLASKGYEGGFETLGLDLIGGEVRRLIPDIQDERIPHVGWNSIWIKHGHPLINNIQDGSDFYFVHSYHFNPHASSSVIATTDYCGQFVSIVYRNNIYGVQFHPEKSHKVGFQLIRNFLQISF